MMRQPDEDNDVVVLHQFRLGRDTWAICLGREKQGERLTLASAIELARDVAVMHSRPAWLLDETGYPWKPIER